MNQEENDFKNRSTDEKKIDLNQNHLATLNLLEDLTQEIEQRKKIEQALRESEEKYKLMFDAAPIAVNITRGTDIIYANQSYLNLYGFSYIAEMNKLKPLELFAPEYRSLVLENIRLRAAGLPVSNSYEVEMFKKDGALFPVIMNLTSLAFSDGEATIAFIIDITERKKAEEELIKSKKLLDETGEMAMVGGWEINIETQNLVWTKEVYRIHEVENEYHATVESAINFYAENSKSIIAEAVQNALENGVPFDLELEIITAKGNIKNVRAKGKKNEINNTVSGTFQDITERKKAKEELHLSEEFNKRIIDSTEDCFKILDLEGKLLSMNRHGQSLLEIDDLSVYLNKSWIDFWKEKDREAAFAAVTNAKKGNSSSFSGYCETEKGNPKWWNVIVSPIFGNNNKVESLLAVSRDITEQKNTENLIRESEEKYRTVINTMNEGLITVDNDDVIQFVNERMLKMTGYSRNELIGKEVNKILVSEEYWDLMKQKNALRLKKESDNYEVEYIKKNGEKIWVALSGSPIIDAKGKVTGSIGVHTDITLRKKSQEKLIQLSQAVEQSPVSIIITDTSGNIQYANPRFSEASGYSDKEVIGLNPRFLKSGHTSVTKYKEMWHTISSGKKWKGEFHNKKKNGELYWESALLSPIVNEYGVITNYLAVKVDITQRKLDEEKLKNSEERFRSVTQSANDAIISSGNDGLIMGWNQGATKIFGYTENEILGKNLDVIIPFNYIQDHHNGITRLDKGEKTRMIGKTVEVTGLDKNGNEFPAEISLANWETSEGIFYTAIIRDITQRKNIEEEKRKIENQNRLLLNNMSEGVIYVNLDEEILYTNSRFCEITGYPTNELLGQKANKLLVDEESEKIINQINERRKHGIASHYEIEMKHKGGNAIWMRVNGTPVRDENGIIIGTMGTYTDITESKQAELLREKIANDLVQRNKDLEQFTYIVSHNLRAPVANIIGFNNIMRETQLGEEVKMQMLEGINASVNKLDEVIKDLNDILQVRHNITEKKEKILLSRIFEDVKHSLEKEIKESTVEIISDFGEVNELNTLKSYMISIFYNFISNSIKYRNPEIKLEVEIKSHQLKNATQLTFKDNGLGIDIKKDGEKIFGLYKRFHTKYAEGKGVGLYMVKTQVETLGGKIEVHSEPGKGTEFIITFEN